MKFSSFAFAAGLGFLATTASFAQTTPAPGSDRARIQQGVKSGELTRAEAARVRTQQAQANQARQAARANGTVTTEERAVIRKEETQADRVLYNQKHDAQTRPVTNDRARIQQGVKSGELTRAEAARVRAQQADTRQARQGARADGVVTAEERAVIRKEEAQADRVLYRQKHDAQTRPRR